MEIYRELEKKGYLNYAEIANASTSGVYGRMYQLISEYDATKGQFGLENTQAARDAYLRAAEYRNTDWVRPAFLKFYHAQPLSECFWWYRQGSVLCFTLCDV